MQCVQHTQHNGRTAILSIEQWAMSVKMCGAVICFLFCCCCAELIWSRMDGTVYGWWTGKVVMGARCLYGWRLRGRQQINIRHTYNTVAYEIIKHREREKERVRHLRQQYKGQAQCTVSNLLLYFTFSFCLLSVFVWCIEMYEVFPRVTWLCWYSSLVCRSGLGWFVPFVRPKKKKFYSHGFDTYCCGRTLP